jgi:tungstate transport system permease protein
MNTIAEGFEKSIGLITSFDRELLKIIFLSLRVSGSALIIAAAIGLPLGALMGLKKFPMKGFFISVSNTLIALPSVVVGLSVYLLLSRSGPLGSLALLYSPAAMIIAQTILAAPIIASLSHSAVISVDPIIKQSSATLGATPLQVSLNVIREARYGIMAAVIAGFGRIIAEVGAVFIVGGNIAGYTRVMTTAIALETDKGNFALALALGIILLCLALVINALFYVVQRIGMLKK